MTLNEAIQHAEAIANSQCGECAEEHRQLAEWLKELKHRREAVEQKHGHWIIKNPLLGCGGEFVCSECGSIDRDIGIPKFCRICGAKMDEEVSNSDENNVS